MKILLQSEQFGKPGEGRDRFVTALQDTKNRNIASHPIYDWIRSEGLDRPALIFDITAIENRMRWLSEAGRNFRVSPLFAVKSCTDTRVLDLAHRYLSGFDISNLEEYSLLPNQLQGRLVSLTSPALTDARNEFRSKGNELLVTVDSQSQLDRHLSQDEPGDYVLRVQGPELLGEVRPLDPAYYPVSRFGFSLEEVKRLLAAPWMKNTLPVGFHVHHGSEVNRLSTYTAITDELKKLAGALNRPLKYLNLGGGWHSLEKHEICDAMKHARALFPEPCNVVFEPGRWFSTNAGYAVGTIVNFSRSGDIVRCTLDLSGKSHLHWSTPRLLHFFDPSCEKGAVVQFYGPSCYESDFIGKYIVPYATDVIRDAGLVCGNQVVFGNISTYSVEWNTSFNGIPKVSVEWICL